MPELEAFSNSDSRLSLILLLSVVTLAPLNAIVLLIYTPEVNFFFVLPTMALTSVTFLGISLYVLKNSQKNHEFLLFLFIISSIPFFVASDVLFPMLLSWAIALVLMIRVSERWKGIKMNYYEWGS